MQRLSACRTSLGRDSRLINALLVATVYAFLILNSVSWRLCMQWRRFKQRHFHGS
jgi:hypothetical protein